MKKKIFSGKYSLGLFLTSMALDAQEPCIDYTIDANLNDDARLMISAFHQTIAKTIGGYVVFGEDISPARCRSQERNYTHGNSAR